MNETFYKRALKILDSMTDWELAEGLKKAGFVIIEKDDMTRLTKQEKLDREAASQIISGLNDFLSIISDVSNETGYSVPDLYMNSLAVLHRELMDTMLGK